MTALDYERMLALPRRKTLEMLDAIEAAGDTAAILGWRPGPGRAHIAWQLMHIAATDDRHLNVRMRGGAPAEPELVKRFAGGSTPDENVPSIQEIRAYLSSQREALLGHLRTLSEADFETKPNDQAPWIYREWFGVLSWHEAHHQGQAHLTFNLFKELHKAK
ncbi:MAG TPA: DinB family protein [Urbifossiella sp.]|jgi:hypothetical protein